MRYEIYGDSIRAGFGVTDKPYVDMISDYVINKSFNGSTVFDIVDLVYNNVEDEEAIAIVGIGINDLIMGRDPKAVSNRIFAIVDKLKNLNKKIIVESILPVKKDYFLTLYSFTEEEINETINELNNILKENESKRYKFLEYDFTNKELETTDGLHPNDAGNNELYLQLKKFLRLQFWGIIWQKKKRWKN